MSNLPVTPSPHRFVLKKASTHHTVQASQPTIPFSDEQASQRTPTTAFAAHSTAGLQPPISQQTPSGSQFQPPPKFKFGSSQRIASSPQQERDAAPHHIVTPSQRRWRPTQTPLRQLQRQETEESIEVEDERNDGRMEDFRRSTEATDMVESQAEDRMLLDELETPAPKRRKFSGDSIESFEQPTNPQPTHLQPVHQEEDRNFLLPEEIGTYERFCEEMAEMRQIHGWQYGRAEDEQKAYIDFLHDNGKYLGDADCLEDEEWCQETRYEGFASAPNIPSPQRLHALSQRPKFILSSNRQSGPTASHPHPPIQPLDSHHNTERIKAPHFILTVPPPPHTPLGPNGTPLPTFAKAPKFSLKEEPEVTQPLPEFSPRKRGQNFVVNGIAAEVRGWLVELESGKRGKNEDGLVAKLKVLDVSGGNGTGPTLIQGRIEDGREERKVKMKIVLGGEGATEGSEGRKKVIPGGVVGVKAPVWEVDIGGERWAVGANWKVL